MWQFLTFLNAVTSPAAPFLGDGLSSAGEFASTFLVILPLEEEGKSWDESSFIPDSMLFSVLSTCNITPKYVLLVTKLRNS